jgi:hypothetical protein
LKSRGGNRHLRPALASRYRNARAASKPVDTKAWVRASQALIVLATVFGPMMGVAAAGMARGGRTQASVVIAANVRQASVWVSFLGLFGLGKKVVACTGAKELGSELLYRLYTTLVHLGAQGVAAIAALLAIHTAAAFLGSLIGISSPAAPSPPRVARAAPYSSAGGASSGSSSGGSGGGSSGGGAPAVARPDPERGAVEAIDLGEPISIIATVIDEAEVYVPVGAGEGVGAGGGCCGCLDGGGGSRRDRVAAAAGVALGRVGAGQPHAQQPVMELVASAAPDGRSDLLVGVLAASSLLLAAAAAMRGVSLAVDWYWWNDQLLLPLQALPELLSAALLLPPHLMARVAMASRYHRWQPKKGKPATSRPKNSNPAIWKRAGMPAPDSRTQTQSDGV